MAVERGEDAAVRDHYDRLAGVRLRERLEACDHARVELAAALASGDHVVRIGLAHAVEGARIAPVDFVVPEALAGAEVTLAEAVVQRDLAAARARDGFRGVERSPEVAGDDAVELLAGETLRERLRLRDSFLGERTVLLPLDARLHVPARLAVTHDDEPGLSPPYRRGPNHWIPAFAGMTVTPPM